MRYTETLNGVWEFAFYGNTQPVPPFVTPEFTVIPGCFDLMEPHCGKRGYAVVKRKVFAGGTVKLFIDGLGLKGEIFWDGRNIGSAPYAYMPESFVFDAGPEDWHELAVIMDNRFNEDFDPFFDFYGYGGIYGDVTLTRLPETYIRRVMISTEDYKNGTIRVQASVAGNYSGSACLVFDTGFVKEVTVSNGTYDETFSLPQFKLWSDEEPNLHTLTFMTGSDEVTETFGIREVRTEGRNILLNGKVLKLVGFNRHESHPEVGAAMPAQLIAADLRLLKENKFNYIRGSHYPQRAAFLELCDKMGFLVWEETIGWGVKPPLLHDEKFLARQLEQVERVTLQNFNHPCIIIRGFLNENYCEFEATRHVIKSLYDKIRSVDAHVLITFASNRYEKDVTTDIVDIVAMNPYPGWYDSCTETINTNDRVRIRLQELSDAMPKDKPFLITEIGAEALLGFRDPLKTYWSEEYQAELLYECCDYVLTHDDCAGISIWHFADTRSYVSGRQIFGRARGFNNKGILDEYRRPKLAWNVVTDLLKEKSGK